MNKVDEKGISYVEQPRVPALSLVISLFSLALISLGALSIFALQKPVAETQEVESQAAVQAGPVAITGTQSPSTLYNSQADTIDLNINTKGLQTTGVTSVFSITTSTTDSLIAQVISSSNLKSYSQEVQKTSTGFLVKVIAVPTGTAPFATSTAIPYLRLTFNPHSSGSFNIVWDQVYSHVYLSTQTTKEELGFVPQMSFVIANNPSAPAANNTISNRTCNQECASNSQCQTGLMCFDNRCRKPGNPDSTVCANVTQITYNSLVKSCNAGCTSNKQCDVNLRCYEGTCRLATNPSSSTCTPSTVPVITSTYASPTPKPSPTATPNPLAGEKGEEVVIPGSTASGTVQPSATPFVWPSPSPVIAVSPTPAAVYETEATDIKAASNPFTAFLNSLRAQTTLGSLSFPLIAVAAGVLLLIIAILLLLTRALRGPKTVKPPMAPVNPRPATNEERSLEQRIAQLKNQQTPPSAPPARPPQAAAPILTAPPGQLSATQAKPAVVLPKPAPTQPTTQSPSQSSSSDNMTIPPTSLSLQSAPVPQYPQSGENSNSMMQRIKEKGLTPTSSKLPNPTESDTKK